MGPGNNDTLVPRACFLNTIIHYEEEGLFGEMADSRLKQEKNKVSLRISYARKQKSAQRMMGTCQNDTETSLQRL